MEYLMQCNIGVGPPLEIHEPPPPGDGVEEHRGWKGRSSDRHVPLSRCLYAPRQNHQSSLPVSRYMPPSQKLILSIRWAALHHGRARAPC